MFCVLGFLHADYLLTAPTPWAICGQQCDGVSVSYWVYGQDSSIVQIEVHFRSVQENLVTLDSCGGCKRGSFSTVL